MKKVFLILFLCIIGLYGCVSYKDYYKLDSQYLARRQLETRFFEENDENKILVACTQVLQDLEFIIDKTDKKIGLITGYKNTEGASLGEKTAVIAADILVSFLGGTSNSSYDVEEKFYINIVTSKSTNRKGYNVRVEFARIAKNNKGETRSEKIEDKKIYNDFFEKLSKSLFLTANNL